MRPLDRRRLGEPAIAAMLTLLSAATATVLCAALEPFGWATLAVGRAASNTLLRLDRLRPGEWGFQEALLWAIGAVAGSLIAVGAAAGTGVELPWRSVAVELLVFSTFGFALESAARLTTHSRPAAPSWERPRRLLIWGSGPEAQVLLACLRLRPDRWTPVGYLDNDLNREEAMVDGLAVLGPLSALPRLAALHQVTELIVPGVDPPAEIGDYCGYAGVHVRTQLGAQALTP